MVATFFQKCDKPSPARDLARQYLRGMVDSKQVRVALRQLRTDANMTPEEFADTAGVNRATVYRIEDLNAAYSPKIETVSALTDGLGLTLSQFFLQIEGLQFVSPPNEDLRPTDPSDQQSATPTTKVAPDARTLSAAERSADAIVQRALIVGLAEEIVAALDRLVESRAPDRPAAKGKAVARRRTGTGG